MRASPKLPFKRASTSKTRSRKNEEEKPRDNGVAAGRRSKCEQLPEDQVPSATLFEPSGNFAVIVAGILARESKHDFRHW
jgi:hypothetical protein